MIISHDMHIALEGLAVTLCPGKFLAAKSACLDVGALTGNYPYLPYWERVRMYYLELGGEYTSDWQRNALEGGR